jgi:hypothetical protein
MELEGRFSCSRVLLAPICTLIVTVLGGAPKVNNYLKNRRPLVLYFYVTIVFRHFMHTFLQASILDNGMRLYPAAVTVCNFSGLNYHHIGRLLSFFSY